MKTDYKAMFLLMLNKGYYYIVMRLMWITSSCRMYPKKPAEVCVNCHICAQRGGWLRCSRSREIASSK